MKRKILAIYVFVCLLSASATIIQAEENSTTGYPTPPHKDVVVNVGSITVDGYVEEPSGKVSVSGEDQYVDVDAYGNITVKASYSLRGRAWSLNVVAKASMTGAVPKTIEGDNSASGELSATFYGIQAGESFTVTLIGEYSDFYCAPVIVPVTVTIDVAPFSMDNNAPTKPDINGPTTAPSGQQVVFSATSTDPDTFGEYADPIIYHWSSSNQHSSNDPKASGTRSNYPTTFVVDEGLRATHTVTCYVSDDPYFKEYGRTSKSSPMDTHTLSVTLSKNASIDMTILEENASPVPTPLPTPTPYENPNDVNYKGEMDFDETTQDEYNEEDSSNTNNDTNNDSDSDSDDSDSDSDSDSDNDSDEDDEGDTPEGTEPEEEEQDFLI